MRMICFRFAFAGLLLAALAIYAVLAAPGLAAEAEVAEPWSFNFDGREWQLVYQTANAFEARRLYTLRGQTRENWSDQVTSVYMAFDFSPR